MRVYKHKDYDFEKGCFPLGVEWKEPEVFAESLNDPDYELCETDECDIEHLKNLYKKRIEDGEDLNLENTAKMYKMVVDGGLSSVDLYTYTDGITIVSRFLSKGYWHSAYTEMNSITPTSSLVLFNTELKEKIKTYVNENYESYFYID